MSARRPLRRQRTRFTREPRTCDSCGRVYHRRDLVAVWTTRAPGSRTGWAQVVMRQCMACSSLAHARRLMIVAQVVSVGKDQAAVASARRS